MKMKEICLITGASKGLGKELAYEFSKSTNICLIARNEKELEKVKASLSKTTKNQILTFAGDISDEAFVKGMFAELKNKKLSIKYLINNAGMNIDAFIEETDMCLFKKVVDTNFTGKVITTKYALPLLKKGEQSAIVNIASRLGTMPCEEASAYCGAASAIINFTKTASLEFAKYKIRVNCVSPSLTITPLALSGWTDEEIQEQTQNNPLGRLATTDDIANAVIFLLSDKASYINGQNINVNGGSLM